MSPEDEIPEADALADATRSAFGRIADTSPTDLSWPAVQTRARRVQRTRVVTAIAAALVVVVGVGTGVTAMNGKSDHLSIQEREARASTTTTRNGSPTTSTAPTTSTSRPSVIVPPATGTTPLPPTVPAPVAQPNDLTGTISMERTTIQALSDTKLTLALHNASDHAVSLPVGATALGLYFGDGKGVGFDYVADPAPVSLASGADRILTTRYVPSPWQIGPVQISAAFIRGLDTDTVAEPESTLSGVPPLPIKVVPPGRTPDQDLDASQGKWTVEMSADSNQVVDGGSVVVQAKVTNVGDRVQQTASYGALAIVCGKYPTLNEYPRSENAAGDPVDVVSLAPGQSQTFPLEYRPASSVTGTIYCSVGLQFPFFSDTWTRPHAGLDSDWVAITVQPAEPATTTSEPSTTSTTTP